MFLFWPTLLNGLGGRSAVETEGAAHGREGGARRGCSRLIFPGGPERHPDPPTDGDAAQSHPADCAMPRYPHPCLEAGDRFRRRLRGRLLDASPDSPPSPAQPSPPDLPSPPSAPPGAPVPSRRRRARELRGRDAAGGSDVFPRLDAALGCRAGEGLSGFSQGTFKLFL